jgi:hypothetical protein
VQLPKHSDEAKAAFRALVPDAPGVEVKPMFAGLFGDHVAQWFGRGLGHIAQLPPKVKKPAVKKT